MFKLPIERTPKGFYCDSLHSRYVRTLTNIFNQKSPQKIQEDYDAAINLHSTQATSSSFFQVVVQFHWMVVLLLLNTGTTVMGMDVVTFTRTVGKEEYFLGDRKENSKATSVINGPYVGIAHATRLKRRIELAPRTLTNA